MKRLCPQDKKSSRPTFFFKSVFQKQLDFQVENQPRAAFVPIYQYPSQKMLDFAGGGVTRTIGQPGQSVWDTYNPDNFEKKFLGGGGNPDKQKNFHRYHKPGKYVKVIGSGRDSV